MKISLASFRFEEKLLFFLAVVALVAVYLIVVNDWSWRPATDVLGWAAPDEASTWNFVAQEGAQAASVTGGAPCVQSAGTRCGDAMPRYYFDIRDGEHVQKDNEGTVLPGPANARVQAVRMLPDLAGDEMLNWDQREVVIEVKDENGRPLLAVRLSLAVETFAK
jgi:hypothetical protein